MPKPMPKPMLQPTLLHANGEADKTRAQAVMDSLRLTFVRVPVGRGQLGCLKGRHELPLQRRHHACLGAMLHIGQLGARLRRARARIRALQLRSQLVHLLLVCRLCRRELLL